MIEIKLSTFIIILSAFTLTFCTLIDTEKEPSEPEPDYPTSFKDTTQIECLNNKAGGFPCKGYNLISLISLETFETTAANDSWGWTDSNGNEYAIIGLNDGVGFVNITPDNPIYLGKLASASSNSDWGDMKVYKNYLYSVKESYGHGLQVFDLTNLEGISDKKTFSGTQFFSSDISRAHNLAINEETGFAYVVGSNKHSGGPVFIDIQAPASPNIVGGYGADNYTHDLQVINYKGPDKAYSGNEILLLSNSDYGFNNRVVILDVTDKSNPHKISEATYPSSGYSHQGWISEDHRYFFFGDELDEQQYGNKTKTLVFDLQDLDNPILHTTYLGTTNAIDHNGYVKGDTFYQSAYTAGVRFIDISDVSNRNLTETGYFDTYPENNSANFNGAWNLYPFFESGKILISDINSGLFVIKKQ